MTVKYEPKIITSAHYDIARSEGLFIPYHQRWPHTPYILDMPEGWFELKGMERHWQPIDRWTNLEAEAWFHERWDVICNCSSARYWCALVWCRPKTPGYKPNGSPGFNSRRFAKAPSVAVQEDE